MDSRIGPRKRPRIPRSTLTGSRRRALVPKPPADLEPIERVGRYTGTGIQVPR